MLAKIGVVLAVPVILYAYSYGPLPGLAGVPGEFGDCTYCHSPGGGGSGSVKVTFPKGQTYTPGVQQHLVVTVADPQQQRWGFELTARHASDSTAQAGTFTPGSDGVTQLTCTQATFQTYSVGSCDSTMPLLYIEQTSAGTRFGQTGSATFSFDWTPPSTNVGNIVIYVAGNAANGDGSPGGDYIYTQKYTLTPQTQTNKPQIAVSNGVFNGAGYQTAICAGVWVTIKGTNLANSTRMWRSSDFVNGKLPTALDGVSVEINGKPAYLEYISPTQINVQAPSDTALGPVNVQVANNGSTSNSMTVQLQSVSPAFFPWPHNYAVATRPDYSYVGPANLFPGLTTAPAKPGDVIILWGTGFGPTKPSVSAGVIPKTVIPSGQIANLADSVSVLIGNAPATVFGAALSPDSAGLYQIAVQVPASTPDGDQPVVAHIAGLQSPSGVFINVQH